MSAARQAFNKAGAKPEGTETIDFLEAVLRERPELRGQQVHFPGQGQKGHTAIIGDEVFKGPQSPSGECMSDFDTECKALKDLEGGTLSVPIPKITTIGKDFLFFGMTKVPGVVMGSDFASRLNKEEQRLLAKDLINFVVEMAHALPLQDGKFAMHDDLYYNNIFIDPKTKRLSGVIDFGLVKYKSPDEWAPMFDFSGTAFYDMLQKEFDRRKSEISQPLAAAPASPVPFVPEANPGKGGIFPSLKEKLRTFFSAAKPPSRVLNFMWLNLDLPAPPDPEDGSIRQPLPENYIENVRKAGAAHPSAEIVLWVDSRRLTARQLDYLKHEIEKERPNVHLKDLRGIPAYDQEPLYNQAETDPNWRDSGQTALIWRQVDAAKILVSLQGNFDQTFFADLDHAHLDMASPPIRRALKKHGLFVGSVGGSKYVSIENQLWGFDRSQRGFFERYYASALKSAGKGENGWKDLVNQINAEILTGRGVELEAICLPIRGDGSSAVHPGHQWRIGLGMEAAPVSITGVRISGAFCKASKGAPANDIARPDVSKSKPGKSLDA